MSSLNYKERQRLERMSLSEFTDALRELLGFETYDAISARKNLNSNRSKVIAAWRRKYGKNQEQQCQSQQ